MNQATLERRRAARPALSVPAASTALWFFMLVATSLFMLFLLAYAMRMNQPDWRRLPVPDVLWLSSAWLVLASLTMQAAVMLARRDRLETAHQAMLGGGACTLLFLCTQLWAWHMLGPSLADTPASSFFYVLTALHGLHVLGGLWAWAVVWRRGADGTHGDAAYEVRLMVLCTRYWHFLLAVWLGLFAALGWLTPELVRRICGTG
ncbi:bb3-type cytochrome oxidase subunit III [Imbroritus primus]|uniref:Bb3-type cytochrome oxidase subunit III n=1 Tax=Imbroritus primus TaxID=3058603 RepID=A0ACD3SS90_9BURK|nr:bb3-type cytochrome oxidase subunit III [Burkholderiaceae bacterium PBA]